MTKIKPYTTENGLVTKMWSNQRYCCRIRGDDYPTYTKDELKEWIFEQPLFHELYHAWIESDFNKDLTPSVDRLNDYNTYSLGNIRLTTWKKNKDKGSFDRRNGINNKVSMAVFQLDLNGKLIKEHHSLRQASRDTGIRHDNISRCCRGVKSYNAPGGFLWKYKNELDDRT